MATSCTAQEIVSSSSQSVRGQFSAPSRISAKLRNYRSFFAYGHVDAEADRAGASVHAATQATDSPSNRETISPSFPIWTRTGETGSRLRQVTRSSLAGRP
mgnify:CR=1 FL=1